MLYVEEGTPNNEPPEGELRPAPDRLWRHPAERGAEQAAANLAARRVYGRRWPSMLMSFIAGCSVVGMVWLLQDEKPARVSSVPEVHEIVPTTQTQFEGTLSFDTWPDEVAQINQTSLMALRLGGNPPHDNAQAILLADDGHLITSAHALIGADPGLITAVLPGGEQIPAQLVGSDVVSGVAVLKITSPELPPPTYGDELQVLAGDRLVGLARNADDGQSTPIIVDLLGKDHVTTLPNDDLLSGLFRLSDDLDDSWAGAAILDENGGIVAMAVESRDGAHYGIPTRLARRIAQELIDGGAIGHKAWLGVDGLVELSDGIKEERNLLGGLLILRVWDETPAAKAGLVAGDIIVGAGSVNVLDRTDLRLVLATLDPGDTIELRYSRGAPTTSNPHEVAPEPGQRSSEILTTYVTVGAAPNS
jgi:serine protease DegS